MSAGAEAEGWSLRRTCQMVAFGVLALLVVLAVGSAFMGGRDVEVQLVATGFMAAIGGGVAIGATIFMDRPRLRRGMTAIFVSVIAGMVLLEAAILGEGRLSWRASEALFMTTALAGAAAVPVCAGFLAQGWPTGRQAGWWMVTSAGTGALFVIPAIIAGAAGSPGRSWIACGLIGGAILVASLPGGAALLRREDEPRSTGLAPFIGVLCAWALSTVMLLSFLMVERGDAAIGAALLLLIGVTLGWVSWHTARFARLPWPASIARHALPLLVFGAFAGFAAEAFLLGPFSLMGGALVVASICDVVGILLLWRIHKRVEPMAPEGVVGMLDCPRCRERSELRAGRGQCPACGLHVRTEVEAPRCRRCRHWLDGGRHERCPECGEPVRVDARAPSPDAPALR